MKNTSSLKTFKAGDNDDDEFDPKNQILPYAESTMQVSHIRVHIDENFKGPSYYRGVVDRLSTLSSNDNVTFFISSGGGDLNGLISLLHAVKYTDANVHCIIVGEAYSAASFFALSCPNISIGENASMMVHHVTFGAVGKASDVHARTQFTLRYCEKLFRDAYEGFLTPSEIQQCLEGKEFWFDSSEIIQRLELREKHRNKPQRVRKVKPESNSETN